MPIIPCSRREILGATAFAAAAAAIPTARYFGDTKGLTTMLVSAERAGDFSAGSQAVVLSGSRLDRLTTMATALKSTPGEVVLRLDATDDSLLDVAAEQAGVNLIRGQATPDGFGIRARVGLTQRNFA